MSLLDIFYFFCYNVIKNIKVKGSNNMKYQLINKPNEKFSAIQQILYNRGIEEKDILHYLNLSD